MTLPSSEGPEGAPSEPESESASAPEAEASPGWSSVVLVEYDGVEPSATTTEEAARAAFAAVTAPWHPALLAVCEKLPRLEPVGDPALALPREVRIIAHGLADRLPAGYRTGAEEAGARIVDAPAERLAIVESLVALLDATVPESGLDDPLARDFFALGAAWWWLRDLTTAMGHVHTVDDDSLAREVLAGAKAWLARDENTTRNHLRAGFEVLTQARERFYPVDAYLVDICLVDPAMPAGALRDALDARTPITFLAQADAVARQAELDPDALARLREAVTEGWADIVGGADAESDEPLLPLDSILWHLRAGAETYRAHLDGRNVETYARRRFGLFPMLPQIAKRFGFRFAYHMGFDAGRFPIRTETKRLWESPDHTHLECLTRPPLAADRALTGLQLAWKLGKSLRDDHVATVPLVHWPSPLAEWYTDYRRVAAYSPVLARWVTLNDYFHLTDRPYETFCPDPDEYVTPYLAQAVARKDPRPVSHRAAHARLRARSDAVSTLRGLAEALGAADPEPFNLADADRSLETGRIDEASESIAALEPKWAGAVARGLAGGTGDRPGYIVLNPTGVARRANVLLPDAAPDLRPQGPLRAAQFTDEGVWAVVELTAFGYAWVPRDTDHSLAPAPSNALSVRNRVMTNEWLSVDVDPASGGIRGIKGVSEDTARLGQQLAVVGWRGQDGAPVTTRMKADAFEVEYAGPALAQAVTSGAILGPEDRVFARFQQRVRLWTGRPLLDLRITLSDLDPAWLASLADADPWSSYLACRWAWPDPASMLRRTVLLGPELTEADRPETPDSIDLSTRRQRTAMFFGGLAHHRRHGPRMLDTILVAGRETERTFHVGVALDLEHPFHGAVDMTAPAYVVPTTSGPPRTGPHGWLFAVDHKSVAVTRVEYVPADEEGRGWGLAFHMLETAGRPARCRLRLFRNPTWARQTDFQGDVIVDLPTDGDGALVDLTPHELARVEVTLG